jgi:hypothetical protein
MTELLEQVVAAAEQLSEADQEKSGRSPEAESDLFEIRADYISV